MSVHQAFPVTDDGSVMSAAAHLAAQASILEDMILDADWQRECWERRIAKQQAAYWARRDREALS